jgi:thioredoxin-related protein
MKTVVTILAGLLLTAMSVMAEESAVEKANAGKQVAPRFMSLADAQAAAAKDGRNVIVDFYTDWCTWCHRFDTVNMVDPKTIEFFRKEMILAEVNAEVDTAIATKFAVSGYPTFVLLNAEGNEIDRVAGYLETDEYIKTMRDYKNGIGTLDAKVAQAKTDTSRVLAYEIADKYKYRGKGQDAEVWYGKVLAVNGKDSLAGESRMAIADMYRRAKNYPKAIDAFKAIAVDFAGTNFEEGADIWTAISYNRAADTTNAIASFEAFIKKYPKSEDVEYAQKQIEKLKGTTAEAGK